MIFATPIIEIIDGKPMDFPKIFIADYEALFELNRAFQKQKFEKAMKEGLLTKEQYGQMLLAIANSAENIFNIQDSIGDPKMMKAILERSWRKSSRTAADFEAFIKEQDPEMLVSLAYRVCRREPVKEEPNPLAPKSQGGLNESSTSDSSIGSSGESTAKMPDSGLSTSGKTP